LNIDSISSNSSIKGHERSANKGSELDKEAFLKLMVAQLKYQNPLEPLKDNEFMSQTASFNSLEQMTNLNSKMIDLISSQKTLYASSLIGKKVDWFEQAIGGIDYREGIVEKVEINEGTPILIIGYRRVSLDNVINVYGNGDNENLTQNRPETQDLSGGE
jgi:flagellar basal-body rod modification protein FlgD